MRKSKKIYMYDLNLSLMSNITVYELIFIYKKIILVFNMHFGMKEHKSESAIYLFCGTDS